MIATQAAGLDAEVRADFEWFSRLGFPDVKGCPYVRVTTGEWSRTGDDPPQNRSIEAFLLATNGNNFTVFTLDLLKRTLAKTGPGAAAHQRVGFELLNLREEAVSRVRALRNPPAKDDAWRRFGEQLSERGEVFMLAWACWRNGLDEEAEDLYAEAGSMPSRRGRNDRESSFREGIERDIGHAMIWRAVVDCGDPSVARHELLRQFENILTNYPHSEYYGRARQTAAVLKRMIAEDERHAQAGSTNLSELSTEEQVRELIYRLRDQNGHQFSQPGSCDIFDEFRGVTNTPAHELVRLGYAAVPQLIVALDSDTLTRSVGYWRNFVFSHTVLTVGDCAETILQRITGKSFFTQTPTSSYYMSADGKASAARRAAEAWWVEFQKKGEKQSLMDAVTAGDHDSPAEGELLSKKYPEVAMEPLVRGARAATNAWIRSRLLEQIAKLNQDRGLEFLKEELERGPLLEARVAAAFGVRPHDKNLAITAMIREWEKVPNITDPVDDDWERIAEFLGGCDSTQAVTALAKNLRRRSPEMKLKVIEVWGETNRWFSQAAELQSAETIDAVEQCLVEALEDTEERTGLSGTRNDKSYTDPRVCDMAGLFLAERWPHRYTFDISAPLKTRDRQRIECINAWRKPHGLPALPLPQTRSIRLPRDQAVKVTLIEWSTDSVRPRESFAGRISRFEGKLLDADDLARLLADFASHPEPNAAGLQVQAIKDDDLTGVRIILCLIPGTLQRRDVGWHVNERVNLGTKGLHNSSGGGSKEAYAAPDEWDDFTAAVKQALAGAPEVPFEISVRLVADSRN